MQPASTAWRWVVAAIVALVIGALGGYYFGNRQGLSEGIRRGVLQEKAA